MPNCWIVKTVAEGIQLATDTIRGSNSRQTLRLVRRPNGTLSIDLNELPLPRSFEYIAVIQDLRHRGEGIQIHWQESL